LFSLPHEGGLLSVAFHPKNSQRLATVSGGLLTGVLKVWDLQARQEILSLRGPASAAYSPDGRRLASASIKVVTLWDADSGQEILTFRSPGSAIYGITFSPDGRKLATCAEDGTVVVWDTAPVEDHGLAPLDLAGHADFVMDLAYSPDGKL